MGERDSGVQDDERYLVVDGRRWRRQDPALPDPVRRALLSHLGRARNGVKNAASEEERQGHRRRVGAAKVGLGERGQAWWEQTDAERRARWEAALAELDPDDPALTQGSRREDGEKDGEDREARPFG